MTPIGAWLERIGDGTASSLQYEAAVDTALDEVADTLSSAVDLDALFRCSVPRAAPTSMVDCNKHTTS